ncbi:MAG: glycoside hydrolase family 2, partial [Mucilaginibacter sp.]|nr:glycoside hydrolase family 2 [Mucilaginibacter sp.]
QNGLAPLHPQFDYLKNTVSVYNDFRNSFKNYVVEAKVYNLDSKLVWSKTTTVNIPADGVVNDAIKIVFPDNITQVHFIKLKLKDNAGKVIADAFYWRSKDAYKGSKTMTGPAVSGFEDMNKLPKAKLEVTTKKELLKGKSFLQVQVSNPSNALSFFTQLKLQDGKGNNLAPAYYSDNFFCLLPGESKKVTIEIPAASNHHHLQLVTDAFNAKAITININN